MRMDFNLEHLEVGMMVFEYFSNSTHLTERASWLASDLQFVWENSLAKCCASICWIDQWRSLTFPPIPVPSRMTTKGGWLVNSTVRLACWSCTAFVRNAPHLEPCEPPFQRACRKHIEVNIIHYKTIRPFGSLQRDFHEIQDAFLITQELSGTKVVIHVMAGIRLAPTEVICPL